MQKPLTAILSIMRTQTFTVGLFGFSLLSINVMKKSENLNIKARRSTKWKPNQYDFELKYGTFDRRMPYLVLNLFEF